ncbi:8484_t:CDS:2 [Funneliformis geosporum]|uniref:CCT-theta n=1 Tax=Funneliformis geosporum TaxID=1117311 RepID=A0A9W4SP85_9GLOM|nr:8484_t:CDS:2 [Funneliformis geosporum]CAI2177606.1 13206_t:CDS:2 [Funneliformis geosporum]
MALKVPKSSYPQLFKEGYKNLQGIEEAVLKNIQAIHELSEIVRTSFGPNGRNKMVINHLEKLFVTNDAATIIRELEVVHPAAKLLVMASQQQEQEVGDGTNFVIIFAGELLQRAEYLLRMGLHPSEIVQGYELASVKALEILEGLSADSVKDFRSKCELEKSIKTSIASKQYGYEDLLSDLVIEASLLVLPKNPQNFNVDSIRIVKILGSNIHESRVVKGMVFGREPEGIVHESLKSKIAIFTCPLDLTQTETKGTVLIHNANEMLNFTKGEEQQIEKILKEFEDAGIKVVVTGSAVGELALHYLNRFNIMVVKVLSKFDLRRLCRVVGASALARLGVPTAEEMGYCDIVETVEIGGDRVTVFRQEDESSKTATIIIRGATQNTLDDVERAIDDGVNNIKAITRDPRLVPGAGATEIELAKQLTSYGEKTPGINQHSIKAFAQALEVFPRTLAEDVGLDTTEILSKLYSSHHEPADEGETTEDKSGARIGVDIENYDIVDVTKLSNPVLDGLLTKHWAIKFATDAALTVLRIDQIIMSKPAGGPKPPQQGSNWDED